MTEDHRTLYTQVIEAASALALLKVQEQRLAVPLAEWCPVARLAAVTALQPIADLHRELSRFTGLPRG